MEKLTVIAHRDPKLLVKGLERTKIMSGQQWFEGSTPRWQVFCQTKNINQVKMLLKDQGATILEGENHV